MAMIDADKLHLKLLDMEFPVCDQDVILDAMEDCIVDAAATVHGMWIDNGWDGDFSWRIDGRGNCWQVISCSVCGVDLCGSAKTSYCPHCGAKMDLNDGEA